MTKTPPRRPPVKKQDREFKPKTVIMMSTDQAKALAKQINKIKKDNPDLISGPLGNLVDLLK